MNKRNNNAPIVGETSLITIFAVLCLIIFTLLMLQTVISSRDLAEKTYESIKSYYTADSKAEQIFAELRSGTIPPEVTVDENSYSYIVEISGTQAIMVELTYVDDVWNVVKWQATGYTQ